MADLHHLHTGVARESDETTETDRHGPETPAAEAAQLVANVVLAVGATPDEARTLIAAVEQKHHPDDIARYMAAMTKSGDLARLLAGIRRATSQTPTPPRWDDYRARVAAACDDHGTPGGAAACPFCRRGIPAPELAREAG